MDNNNTIQLYNITKTGASLVYPAPDGHFAGSDQDGNGSSGSDIYWDVDDEAICECLLL